MKYQSELIKEIVDNRGHETSSLHYESECIEAWIDETKGAYPKLCDYQSEWLNYIVENPIGKFPYKSVVANPTVTVENVVPYAYKSAILSGNTLVNLIDNKFEPTGGISVTENHLIWTENVTNWQNGGINLSPIMPFEENTTYTVIVKSMQERAVKFGFYSSFGWFPLKSISLIKGENKFLITSKEGLPSNSYFRIEYESNDGLELYDIIILKGDYINTSIPYFEGMQSVKMPVLTTTGKNLLKPNRNSITSIHLKKGTTLILSTKNSIPSLGGNAKFYGIDGNAIWMGIDAGSSSKKFTLPCDIYRIENTLVEGDGLEYQLEIGTVATPYEPYKTNILTVNEDVVLRGIGDVRDELDLLTGEVSQNLIEFEFNDDKYFASTFTEFENTIRWQTTKSTRELLQLKTSGKIYSPNFITDNSNNDFEHIRLDGSTPYANLVIYLSKTKASTYEEFKTYIKNNPFTIVAEKAEKSIKTVELTVTNQNGETMNRIRPIEGTMNLTVSGTPIYPTGQFQIPVEAITQNLSSFIEE